MSQFAEDDGYIPEWRKYPVERCVMKKEKNILFRAKCRKLDIPKSRAINDLIDLWLEGKITL